MATPSATIRSLQQEIQSCDVSGLPGHELQDLLATVRRADRALVALKARIGRRADQLAEAGRCARAEEALLGGGDVNGKTARNDAARSRLTRDMPEVGKALDEGAIGGDQLDAISQAMQSLDDEERQIFNQAAEQIVADAAGLPADTFKSSVKRRADRIKQDHGRGAALAARERANLRHWTKGNEGFINGSMDLESYARLTAAISQQAAAMAAAGADAGEKITRGPNLDMHALVELVQHANGSMGRPDVSVIVDQETLENGAHDRSVRETVDGHELPPETIARLCCDAVLRRVVIDAAGVPIDVGRRHRTATDAQWKALKAIHSTCAWNGCTRPISWCQAHHIDEWERGGLTDLDNLVPLCSRHHHHVHEGRWTIKLLPDRTLRIHRPDGVHHGDSHPDRLAVARERVRKRNNN